MLKLKDVSKFYYNKGVIATGFTKVNLELKIGEFVVITGESGSGKSTLLNVLSGLDSYEEGEMYINDEETSHYGELDFENYRKQYVANIFQNFNLINSYTVYQNVELVLLLNGYSKRKIKKDVLEILKKVNLYEFRNTKVSKLSGGQKQRVAIARALAKNTPIIIADEPTGNLDSKSAEEIVKLLKEISKDKLVIVVTHNIEQVEQYATRIIKMYDGRILENKEVKKVEEIEEIKREDFKKTSLISEYRLGIRNAFNVKTKFILLFAVFLFITAALLLEYSSFQKAEYEEGKLGYNIFFKNLSDKRIVLKKEDGTSFSVEDYEKIKQVSNLDYIIEDDILLETSIYMSSDIISLYGSAENIQFFNGDLDLGRMPENEYEIIAEGYKDDYNIGMMADELLATDLELKNTNSDTTILDTKLRVVGIKYKDGSYNYHDSSKYYVSSVILKELRKSLNENYSKIQTLFEGQYYDSTPYTPYFHIVANENVKSGEALASSELNYLVSSGNCKNKELTISAENIYYSDDMTIKITNTYTKNNFKKLTGLKNYDSFAGTVFVNPDDYNNLFNKATYQSSVFVKNIEEIDTTIAQLQEIGMKTLAIKDVIINDQAELLQVVKIFKLVVTIGLIITMFFISYFIIKIILKSRNVYFATLRMLGGTKKVAQRLLDIELFIISTLSYIVVLIIVSLSNGDFMSMLVYLGIREYILMYAILVIMSRLISRRFSKSIFKKTAVKTYNEEV